MLSLDSIEKQYSAVTALNGITFDFPSTGLFFIKGKSGCGKTTLLNILGGLDVPTSGSFSVNGINTATYSQKEWDDYRNGFVGFVFQDYNLLEGTTVEKNIELALDIQNELDQKEAKKVRVREALSFVGLEGYEKRKDSELSGGQKQRVAIARAIAKQSAVILADEPTGNLDSESGKQILSLLKSISRSRLVIIVTHDVVSALEYGDHIISMEDGRITGDISLSDADPNRQRCSVNVTNDKGISVFSLTDDTVAKAKDHLAQWLFYEGGGNGLNFDIKMETIDIPLPDNAPIIADKKGLCRSMPFRNQVVFALQNLSQKKTRLFFTCTMFILTLFLFLSASFILAYDRVDTISDYLQSQNTREYYLYQDKGYEDLLFRSFENTICKGEKHYNNLSSLLPCGMLVPRYMADSISYQKSDEKFEISDSVLMYCTDQPSVMNKELAEGRFPVSADEIVITDYIAKYGLSEEHTIGKTVFVDNIVPMTVVGIIRTDCVDKQIALKSKLNGLNEFERFDLENVYNIAVVGSGFTSLYRTALDTIELDKSNFLYADLGSQYMKQSYVYGKSSSVSGYLKEGRLPREKNEVLVSSSVASFIEELGYDIYDKDYHFLDIYQESYLDTYSDTLNIYDFFPDGFRIVGVFEADFLLSASLPDVAVMDSVFEQIVSLYDRYYIYRDYVLEYAADDYRELTETLDSAGFLFYEPAIQKIYGFEETLNSLSVFVILFFAVVLAITSFMLNLYLSANIKNNSKRIGVLKAIGVQTGQISGIFLMEAVIISVISYLVSMGLTAVFVDYVNNGFVKQVAGHEFEYLYWNWGIALLVGAFSILLSILSSLIPILKLSHKKPVEVIRTVQF